MKAVKKEASANRDRTDPWPTALRILSRRDYSCSELRSKLIDKGFAPDRIEETLTRGQELGYLNDERFATNRAASLMNQGRAVGYRVLQDLRQRGISDELAEQALARAREDFDEQNLLADLLIQRFPGFAYQSAPAREKRRVVNFLQRRGFSLGLIMDFMTRKGSAINDEDR